MRQRRRVDGGEFFEEKMVRLAATPRRHQVEVLKFDTEIAANIQGFGFGN